MNVHDYAVVVGISKYGSLKPELEGPEPVQETFRATAPPGMRSAPHHHGEAETGVYVISGHCRFYYGEGFSEYQDAGPGDLVFVPPNTPHIEANLSAEEPAELIGVRSPSNIVINLE